MKHHELDQLQSSNVFVAMFLAPSVVKKRLEGRMGNSTSTLEYCSARPFELTLGNL